MKRAVAFLFVALVVLVGSNARGSEPLSTSPPESRSVRTDGPKARRVRSKHHARSGHRTRHSKRSEVRRLVQPGVVPSTSTVPKSPAKEGAFAPIATAPNSQPVQISP